MSTWQPLGRHQLVQQEPRIPIWIGGGYPNPGPTRRAARWDGSCLYREQTHTLTPDDVTAIRENAGERPYDIAVGGAPRWDDWDEQRAYIRAVGAAGATCFLEWIAPADQEAMRTQVDRGPLRG